MINPKFVVGLPRIIIVDSYLENKYYLGLYTALKYWKISDAPLYQYQVITNKRRLSGKKIKIAGLNIRFIYLNEKAFFGYQRYPYMGALINISDLEKTIIDSVYFLGKYVTVQDIGKALFFAKNRINLEKLISYLERVDSPSVNQRLGFLLEYYKIIKKPESFLNKLRISNRYILLNPYGPRISYYRSNRWRLIINCKLWKS